jgi:DNA-binding transcriptional LysR family regulator
LQKIEKRFLIDRTTRSVAATDAGQRMLGQLRPLLDGFQTHRPTVLNRL